MCASASHKSTFLYTRIELCQVFLILVIFPCVEYLNVDRIKKKVTQRARSLVDVHVIVVNLVHFLYRMCDQR